MINQIRRYLRRKTNPLDLLHQVLPLVPPLKTLVHVGAHLAQERHQYESHGYQNILWIEGSSQVYGRLVDVIASHEGPAKHATQCALLTDQDDAEVQLIEFSNDGMSSSIFGATERLTARWPEVTETGATETIRSSTLDSLLQGTDFAVQCDLLVVDVQGAELLVLKGAERTLAKANAVICEVSTVPYYDGGVLYDELADYLTVRGFVPMSTPRRHGDMLFIRQSLLARAVTFSPATLIQKEGNSKCHSLKPA